MLLQRRKALPQTRYRCQNQCAETYASHFFIEKQLQLPSRCWHTALPSSSISLSVGSKLTKQTSRLHSARELLAQAAATRSFAHSQSARSFTAAVKWWWRDNSCRRRNASSRSALIENIIETATAAKLTLRTKDRNSKHDVSHACSHDDRFGTSWCTDVVPKNTRPCNGTVKADAMRSDCVITDSPESLRWDTEGTRGVSAFSTFTSGLSVDPVTMNKQNTSLSRAMVLICIYRCVSASEVFSSKISTISYQADLRDKVLMIGKQNWKEFEAATDRVKLFRLTRSIHF